MHACRLVRSGEIKYKIKGVVGVRGMLRANLRHTQQLHVSPHVEGADKVAAMPNRPRSSILPPCRLMRS